MKTIQTLFVISLISFSTLGQYNTQLDSLTELSEKTPEKKLDKYLKLASFYARIDSEKSMSYTDQALAISKNMESSYWQGITLFNSATNSYIWCDYTKTLNTYLNCLNIFLAIDSTNYIFKVYSNMGNVYNRIADYENELYYYLKAYSLYQKTTYSAKTNPTNSEILKLYNNISNVYQRTKQYQLAIDYYNKALEFAKNNNDFSSIASINLNLARHYCLVREMKKSESFLTDALEAAIKSDAPEKKAATHVMYMYFLLTNKKAEQAIVHGKKALNYLEKTEFKDIKRNTHQYLYFAYGKIADYKNALIHHRNYKKLYDEIINGKNIADITKIKLKYEYDKKQRMQQIITAKKRKTNTLFITILSLTIIVLVFLYIVLKKRTQLIAQEKRNIKIKLESKNKELASKLLHSNEMNSLINSVVEKLTSLKTTLKKKEANNIQKIIWELNGTINHTIWDEFEIVFKQIHSTFYKRLHQKFPNLTPSEKRLAAFLRLNFSTKEIARITGQSGRSLEVARYRLRKNLNLTNQNISLTNFLHNLDK